MTLANASPQVRGSILGAHNGDVDRDSVPLVVDDPSMGTDSAVLLEGLSLAVYDGEVDIDLACKVLQSVRGRVACSWAVLDHNSSPYLWLARGAHSPLSVGVDRDGGVWWASEAWWLDELCQSVTTLPEGSVVLLSRRSGVSYRQVASFVPQPRSEDIARLSHLRYAPTH